MCNVHAQGQLSHLSIAEAQQHFTLLVSHNFNQQPANSSKASSAAIHCNISYDLQVSQPVSSDKTGAIGTQKVHKHQHASAMLATSMLYHQQSKAKGA